MPEPVAPARRYMPGLDGLRAVAVIAVVLYHLGVGWMSGGLLGVGVFFTLSGYLITDLILAQRATRRLSLKRFWLARARRLLPALGVMLIVISVWTAIARPAELATVRGQVFAACVYISNWWQSFQNLSYFQRFGAPSPLNHLWSLSVEEQFYLVWPWLLLGGIAVVREHPGSRGLRPRLALMTVVLAVISAVLMAVLYHPSFDPSRVYYGTDTRAFGLLFGAALAMVWPSRSLRVSVGARAPVVLDIVGTIGLAGIVVMCSRTNEYAPFIYRGGLVLLSLLTMMALTALTHPAARLGRVLGCAPLRWIGERSYAIYLWSIPIIVLTTPAGEHTVHATRAILQVAATLAVCAVSWTYLENPIRHGALGRAFAQLRRVGWAGMSRLAVTGASGLAVAVLVCVVALAGAFGGSGQPAAASARAGDSLPPPASIGEHRTGSGKGSGPVGGSSGRIVAGTRPMSACERAVVFGDSTSEGMISNDYLPDPSQQIVAQLAAVGVHETTLEITGGTSIIETLPGDVNALSIAQQLRASGFDGCWIIGLGTNDVADVYVGSNVSIAQRIDEMMATIGNQAVLWETTRTLVTSGPYANSGMRQWNAALVAACKRYPNMRVFDWAAAVRDAWFIPDGIHYYSPGYAARAQLTAKALALAFPAHAKRPNSCLIETGTTNVKVRGIE